MSGTIVDMPKFCQMLDAGWAVEIYKGGMGTYYARGRHANMPDAAKGMLDDDGEFGTDDFTPEQALTRLAYKAHGEII